MPNNRNMKIVTEILGIVKTLDMIAVAEGVETSEQLMLIKELACDIGQTYFFVKPCSFDQITQKNIS
jgi:EAL domain-containing protein (putative c-di-GMP-specific phosphodiesterase class I)